VPRINTIRTTARLSSNRLSCSGRKSVNRDHRPKYGGTGACACSPTNRSTIAVALSFRLRSNDCRSSSARFRARTPSSLMPP
jgi:hypothetical protein